MRFLYLLFLEMAAKIVLKDVQEASKRIAPYIHRTPIMTCSTLDKMAGKSLFFKCEIFQKVGAFKVRITMILEVDNIYLQCYILACIEERTVCWRYQHCHFHMWNLCLSRTFEGLNIIMAS